MRFTTHTGLKLTPIELRCGRKTRTESTTIKKEYAYLFDWSALSVSAEKPKIPICVIRDKEGDVSNYLVMRENQDRRKSGRKGAEKEVFG